MPPRALWLLTAVLPWLLAAAATRADDRPAISPDGEQLSRYLDAMDVEDHWLARTRVEWETGFPVGPSSDPVHSTHCSAFVAAACRWLDVPMLHPPDHPQKLLANAQYDWLVEQGARNGWRKLDRAADAQNLANRGQLVVAVYKNPRPTHPGHIAIVRPAKKTGDELAAEGPDITQAGRHNYRRTSVRHGFASHALAFEKGQIGYFAHPIAEGKTATRATP